MIRLVQIGQGKQRRVALVREPELRCLEGVESIYALAWECAHDGTSLIKQVEERAKGEVLSYDSVYGQSSEWRLLSPIDTADAPEHLLISGTGLTHLGSANDRQAMHERRATADKPLTDSMRMFQSGIEGGRPKEGEIGVPPEWFYKGNGSILQAPFAALSVPPYAEDGSEEAEVAGIYLIDSQGVPWRIGMCVGNEFADHVFERGNYLNLAGSKLRQCSVGPELVVGGDFGAIKGEVSIERNGNCVWHKAIETGEENMSHSLANLEHHHFKYEAHRIPGQVHVHFFGAHSLSFGEGITLESGDVMQIRFDGFGRALRNPLRIESKQQDKLVRVQSLD